MIKSSPPSAARTGPDGPQRGGWRRGWRRAAAGLVAVLMALLAAPSAFGATAVTQKAAEGLKAAGPTSAEYGFPTWYEDKAGTRLEPCFEPQNPLCGFLPGDVPDPAQPISFPDNFPEEFFYSLVGSTLTLPGGGRAVLTSGLEGAFVDPGPPLSGQQVFTRIRIVVTSAAPNTTYQFLHPYGRLSIDTDGTGKGRLVRDVAPSVGNFTLALGGDMGPFVKALNPPPPAGYLGDPAVPGTITGGPAGNAFVAFDAAGTEIARTDQFTVQGKVATNTGVTGDGAVANGTFVDVFASTAGAALEVVGQDGTFDTTIMQHDAVAPGDTKTHRFYARVQLKPGATAPASVDIRNNGDNPPSKATVPVQSISVTQAAYDGAKLLVTATAPTSPITVEGFGTVTSGTPATFDTFAPPAAITVMAGSSKITVPVAVTGGQASEVGTTVPPAGPNPGPVCDTGAGPGPCGPDGVPTTAAPKATVAAPAATVPLGIATTIDGSTSTNATSFETTFVSGPGGANSVTITNGTTNKPVVTVKPLTSTADTTGPRPATATQPTVVAFSAINNGTKSTVNVTITPAAETLTLGTARYIAGKDFRVTGTSAIAGIAAGTALNPQTTVTVYAKTAVTGAAWVKIGTSPVDTTGAWAVRPTPVPTTAYTQYLVESSRGGTLTGNLQLR